MPFDFLRSGPTNARVTVLLAHGAGAPMDSANMESATTALVDAGLAVVRFEFGYMAQRRVNGGRKPPPWAAKLKSEYREAVDELAATALLIIGGKSMGGRVASMVADDLYLADRISGLFCLGYPFHPNGKPDSLRTAHLKDLQTPTLIAQGTRDSFGNRDEVTGYGLSRKIEILWLEDGDHNLSPRKTISGFTFDDHLKTMAENVANWANRIATAG